MISDIDRLQVHCRVTDRILEALASDEDPGPILQQLREGQPLPTIAGKLATEDSATPEGSNAHTGEGKNPSPSTSEECSSRALEEAGGDTSTTSARLHHWVSSALRDSPSEGSTTKSTVSKASPDVISRQSRAESLEIKLDGLPIEVRLARLTEEALMLPSKLAERMDLGPNSPNEPNQTMIRQSMVSPLGSPVGKHNVMPDAVDHWSNVTDDKQLIEDLLTLYFCWEYPTFASLSQEHFYQDFYNGRRRFCSSLLVNVLLAMGSSFSNRPEARTDANDSETAGDHFFSEAKRLLALQTHPTLTTVQALGLMSLREASHGRYSIASFYAGESIRMAVECGLHTEKNVLKGYDAPSAEQEVRSATFWGCFSLDQAWAMAVGRIPHISRNVVKVTKPAIFDDVEASEWTPDMEGEPMAESAKAQPSNIQSVYNSFCELSEIVNDTLYTLYTPGRPLRVQRVLTAYTQYLDWYNAMSDELRLGQNFTPSVLFVHMYYHVAILLLLRPLIRYRYLQSVVSPRDICTQAAENITSLLRSYRQLYSLRRTPSFVPYIVLNASVMHLVNSHSPLGSAYTMQCIEDLQAMSINHGFAKEAVKIIKYLAARVNPEVYAEDNVEEITLSSTSLNFFCPASKEELLSLEEIGEDSKGNKLFNPFPYQGLPLIE